MSEESLESFESEQVIFTEGDVGNAAYIVLSGSVELIESNQGREEQIAVCETGRAFGELALFDPAALRPYTARTTSQTKLNKITAEEFKRLLGECPKAILPFLMLVFEKMKSTKVKNKIATKAVQESDFSKIIVAPDSEKLKAQFKPITVPSNRLPFRIGGKPEEEQITRRGENIHLYISAESNPLRVSRQHCEIVVENKSLILTDLGSRFCTTVNGVTIGRGHGIYNAPLQKGANTITLGAADGPYKITVTCE